MRTSIHPDEKREIFEAARAQMRAWYGPEMEMQGACLYWNQVAMRELALRGYKPILQAGDLLWKIVPDSMDDGIAAQYFSYEWSPHEALSVAQIASGHLPEIHIWCGLPETGDCVDFSVSALPKLAKEQHGYEWRTDAPPEYVFGQPPADAVYRPNVEAIRFVWRFIANKMAPPGVREKILQMVEA